VGGWVFYGGLCLAPQPGEAIVLENTYTYATNLRGIRGMRVSGKQATLLPKRFLCGLPARKFICLTGSTSRSAGQRHAIWRHI